MTDIRSFPIKGYISDTNMQTDFIFSVIIFNEPPFFESTLRDQRLMLRYEAVYNFPQIKDMEDLPFKVRLQTTNNEPLPSFIKLNEKNVTFKPISVKDAKVFQLEFVLDDSYSPPARYPFKITVEDPMNSKLLRTGDFRNSTEE
jgi:hypothetical protein